MCSSANCYQTIVTKVSLVSGASVGYALLALRAESGSKWLAELSLRACFSEALLLYRDAQLTYG